MKFCFNHSYFSSSKAGLTQYELFNEGRGNILGQVGLQLGRYINKDNEEVFKSLLELTVERFNSLASIYHNSDIIIKGIDYDLIKHPTTKRKIPNIPDIKTFSYRADGIKEGSNDCLAQTFIIKSEEVNLSVVDSLLTTVCKGLMIDVVNKIPSIGIQDFLKMDDYKGAYFDPYGIYYSSKIFQGVYENNASLTESDKKMKPVACGYFSSNFKKQLSCNERGMLKQHVFDIDELIKEGHIKSKSIWDANMSKCIKEVPGGVCNSDISLLSPYNSINHFYISTLDESLIDFNDIMPENELLKTLLMQGMALGDILMQTLSSVYNMKLNENIGFEALMPYLTKMNFSIGENDYTMIVDKPSKTQLVKTTGLMPFVVLAKDGENNEKFYKDKIRGQIRGKGCRDKTISLSKKLLSGNPIIKKIKMEV